MKLHIALSVLSAAVSTATAKPDKKCQSVDIGSGPYGVGYLDAESSATTPIFGSPNFAPADVDRPVDALENPGLGFGKFIPFDAYYPTDATAGDPAKFTVEEIPIFLKGAIAAPVISTPETCWPLVIQSHGSGSLPAGQFELSIALASQGWIVITPAHIGDVFGSSTDFLANPAAYDDVAKSRVLDITSVLDYVLATPVGSLVCPDQIAAIGVSFGAFTALAAANGYTSPGNDPPNTVVTFDADERIGAVVAMAPFTLLFGNPLTDLVESDVHTLMLAMEDDELTPILSNADPLWDTIQCTTELTYRVDFAGAGHSSPSSACDIIDQFEVAFATILGKLNIDLAGGVAGVCASIDANNFPAAVVNGCYLYFSQLTTKVSAGCMVDDDVCDVFGVIAAGLLGNDVNPVTDCTGTLDATESYVCFAFGTLIQGDDPSRSFLDPDVCSGLTLPILSGDDAKEITNTYVVSYLQTVLGRDDDKCFKLALKEKYASVQEMDLPVVDSTLFLNEAVEEECGFDRV